MADTDIKTSTETVKKSETPIAMIIITIVLALGAYLADNKILQTEKSNG